VSTATLSWSNVRKGRRSKPDRIFLYAVDKFGKTSFAAGAPNAVFLDFEDGTAEIEGIESFDMRGAGQEQILQTLDMILAAPNGKQAVVIDTADAMERSIQKSMMAEQNVTSIEEIDGGYGKGYVRTAEAFSSILKKLDELREAGFTVIVLAHAGIVSFNNPTGADYKRFEPKLEKRTCPLPKEWADAILFGQHEEMVVGADKRGNKGKGTGGRRRVIHTVRTAAYDAGNRYGLPAKLVLSDDPSESWGIYAKARAEGRASVERMMAEAEILLAKIVSEDERKAIREWIESKKDNNQAVLAGLNRLREKIEASSNVKPEPKKEEAKS